MNRQWLWLAILLLPLDCRAQSSSEDVATFDVATFLKNEDMETFIRTTVRIQVYMPDNQRDLFAKALELDYAGNLRGAVSTLQPLVDSGRADAHISLLLGGLLARDRQWKLALQAYQAALKTLGPKAATFDWDVEWGLGETLLHLRRFGEASSHLEAALRREVREDILYEVYQVTGRAYEGAGNQLLAVQAFLDAVCIYPSRSNAWLALNRVTAHFHTDHVQWSRRLARPPSQLIPADAIRVARAVASGQQLSDDDRFAYVRMADALYQADRVQSGGRFLRTAFRDYLDREWPEAEIRLNVEKTLALLESFGFLPRLTVGTQYHLLSLLAVYRMDKGLYAQVIPAVRMISVLALTESQKKEMTGFLKDYYTNLLAAVSFDPATGRPRFADPDDFLGPCMDYEVYSGDQAHPQRDPAEIPSKDANGKCLVKYGTLNPSEDLATTEADIYVGKDFAEGSTSPLLPILEDRIRQKEFDLPVKAVLAKLTSGDFQDIERGEVARLSLTELERAMQSAGPSQVHEITLEAFDAAKQAPELFRMFATQSPEKEVRRNP